MRVKNIIFSTTFVLLGSISIFGMESPSSSFDVDIEMLRSVPVDTPEVVIGVAVRDIEELQISWINKLRAITRTKFKDGHKTQANNLNVFAEFFTYLDFLGLVSDAIAHAPGKFYNFQEFGECDGSYKWRLFEKGLAYGKADQQQLRNLIDELNNEFREHFIEPKDEIILSGVSKSKQTFKSVKADLRDRLLYEIFDLMGMHKKYIENHISRPAITGIQDIFLENFKNYKRSMANTYLNPDENMTREMQHQAVTADFDKLKNELENYCIIDCKDYYKRIINLSKIYIFSRLIFADENYADPIDGKDKLFNPIYDSLGEYGAIISIDYRDDLRVTKIIEEMDKIIPENSKNPYIASIRHMFEDVGAEWDAIVGANSSKKTKLANSIRQQEESSDSEKSNKLLQKIPKNIGKKQPSQKSRKAPRKEPAKSGIGKQPVYFKGGVIYEFVPRRAGKWPHYPDQGFSCRKKPANKGVRKNSNVAGSRTPTSPVVSNHVELNENEFMDNNNEHSDAEGEISVDEKDGEDAGSRPTTPRTPATPGKTINEYNNELSDIEEEVLEENEEEGSDNGVSPDLRD